MLVDKFGIFIYFKTNYLELFYKDLRIVRKSKLTDEFIAYPQTIYKDPVVFITLLNHAY